MRAVRTHSRLSGGARVIDEILELPFREHILGVTRCVVRRLRLRPGVREIAPLVTSVRRNHLWSAERPRPPLYLAPARALGIDLTILRGLLEFLPGWKYE